MFKKLMAIFNRRQKIHLLLLGIMIFIGGIVETLGVSAMLPVISVILDQESLQSYEIVGKVMDIMHMETMQTFTMFLLAMLIGVYVLKNLYTIWLTYEQNRFITVNKNKMISQVLREFLNRPYEFYLDADIPTVFRMTDSDIPNLFQLMMVLLQFASEAIVFIFLAGVLVNRLENGGYDGWRIRRSDHIDEQRNEAKAERAGEKEPGSTVQNRQMEDSGYLRDKRCESAS